MSKHKNYLSFLVIFLPLTLFSQVLEEKLFSILKPSATFYNDLKIISDSIIHPSNEEQVLNALATQRKTPFDSLKFELIKLRLVFIKRKFDIVYQISQNILSSPQMLRITKEENACIKIPIYSLLSGYFSMKGDDISSYFYIKELLFLSRKYYNNSEFDRYYELRCAVISTEILKSYDNPIFVKRYLQNDNLKINEQIDIIKYHLNLYENEKAIQKLTAFPEADKKGLPYIYLMALSYYQESNFLLAEQTLNLSDIKNAVINGETKFYLPKIYLLLGKIHFNKKDFDKAIGFLNQALQEFPTSPNVKYEQETEKLLYECYTQKQDYSKANWHLLKAMTLLEDLNTNSSKSAINSINGMFELQEQQTLFDNLLLESNKKDSKIDKLKKSIFTTSMFLVLLSILTLVLFRFYKDKRKNNLNLSLLNAHLLKSENTLQQKNVQLEFMLDRRDKIIERLKKFASILSHDIREPIRSIDAFGKLLNKRAKDKLTEQEQEFLGFMIDGSSRLTQMVNTLYEYSNNTLVLLNEFKPVDLQKIIKKIEQDLTYRIKEKNAQIIANNLPTVYGQDIMIYQLFQNLIANSLKYSKEGVSPIIEITSQKEDNKYSISLKDNGIGVKKEELHNLFEFFKRSTNVTSQSGHGIGLGTCKEIIELHGGQIWIESELGIGTTVFLSFPIEDVKF